MVLILCGWIPACLFVLEPAHQEPRRMVNEGAILKESKQVRLDLLRFLNGVCDAMDLRPLVFHHDQAPLAAVTVGADSALIPSEALPHHRTRAAATAGLSTFCVKSDRDAWSEIRNACDGGAG